MELIKSHWNKSDIKQFQEYLKSLSKGEEKGKWEQRIINTSLPCLAVPAPEVKKISNEIAKGNFMEFIDLWPWENFTNTSIIGTLICKIKDFAILKKYLIKFANKVDNWAGCDLLKFGITENSKAQFFSLSQELVKSAKPFVRRIGMNILFNYIKDEQYLPKIFETLNSFETEKEYYVNMVNAWLVAECFAKQREKTLEFLKTNKLNKFTINKAISKCRDSYRVSNEDKEMLKQFRK